MLSWGVAWNASAENMGTKLRINDWKAERETSHRGNYGIFSDGLAHSIPLGGRDGNPAPAFCPDNPTVNREKWPKFKSPPRLSAGRRSRRPAGRNGRAPRFPGERRHAIRA